jgi:hypothetical protein
MHGDAMSGRERALQMLREQDQQRRAHATALVRACRQGDAERFYHLAYPYDNHPADFWSPAFRMIARSVVEVSPEIQQAFQQVWIETKMLGLRCDSNLMLCRALRVLMPAYKGPEMKLYRGASALERRRRAYGASWTSSLSAAEKFAQDYRVWPGGSVVLETVAAPEAIISAVEYPPPLTEAEKADFPPNVTVTEFHEEVEYLVDRRLLGRVEVRVKYPCASALHPSSA